MRRSPASVRLRRAGYKAFTDRFPDGRRVLADARSKTSPSSAAVARLAWSRCDRRKDRGPPWLRTGTAEQRPHIAADARDTVQAAIGVKYPLQSIYARTALAEQPSHKADIQVVGPHRHEKAAQRTEAHCGSDAVARGHSVLTADRIVVCERSQIRRRRRGPVPPLICDTGERRLREAQAVLVHIPIDHRSCHDEPLQIRLIRLALLLASPLMGKSQVRISPPRPAAAVDPCP